MSKNKEKVNLDELKGRINTHAEFGDKKMISIITITKANNECINCAAPPECRGQSPKKWPCSKFEPRK
jgi:fructose-bisphosphate aldolase class 1